MKHQTLSMLAAVCVLALAAGCSDQPSVQSTDLQPGNEQITVLEARTRAIAEDLDALGEIANDPDGGVGHWTEGGFVELPDGSVDGLADAIAAAGEGGTVLVRAGTHTESDAVVISQSVRIVGEQTPVMNMTSDSYSTYPTTLDPALHIKSVEGKVLIWNLDIESTEEIGGVAILVEHSPQVVIGRNTIAGFQIGIYGHDVDNARIIVNTIVASPAWQTGEIPESGGIIIANGTSVGMKRNDVANGLFGVFGSGVSNLYVRNRTHDGYIGLILCKVPSGSYTTPSGEEAGSAVSATGYLVRRNQSVNNLAEGYLVIDGANGNVLVENAASDNGTYDCELAGDSYRFGFLTPACFNNVAVIAPSMVVKNCGNDNQVFGGILVDNDLDPCY